MFRKPNKTTINKNKMIKLLFESRLYLDISRSFSCPKCLPMICLIFLYTCLGSLKVVFLLQEYILKVHGSCLF